MVVYKELSDKIIGAVIKVHKTLGNGFLEKVYENAPMVEFRSMGIPANNQVPIDVHYKGEVVGEYFADVLVEDKIILELKVVKAIDDIHIAQVLHYLKAIGMKVGYVINFGTDKLSFKRLVN